MADLFSRFDATATSHKRTNAYLCALLSHYCYEREADGESLPTFFGRLSANDPLTVEEMRQRDSEVLIAHNSRCIWVAFRGTDELKEWVDIDFGNFARLDPGRHANLASVMRTPPSSWGPGRVHTGFYNALNDVYQSLETRVRALRAEHARPVFLTGHSRGGALATLCAYRFQAVGDIPVSGVYTFGGPRVGDADAFVVNYTQKGLNHGMNLAATTFRWMYAKDPAPAVPFVSQKALVLMLAAAAASPASVFLHALAPLAVVPAATLGPVIAVLMGEHARVVPNSQRYSHVGLPFHYLANGSVSSTGLDRDYSPHSIESLFEGNLLGVQLSNGKDDHAMTNYVIAMHNRLFTGERETDTNPAGLVRSDVPNPFATGFGPTIRTRPPRRTGRPKPSGRRGRPRGGRDGRPG